MTEQNNNQELINETIQLMDLSSMDEDERVMWKVILPSLLPEEIQKLKAALEKEVKTMTDIYLKAKQEIKN